jgi:hypothetical protein
MAVVTIWSVISDMTWNTGGMFILKWNNVPKCEMEWSGLEYGSRGSNVPLTHTMKVSRMGRRMATLILNVGRGEWLTWGPGRFTSLRELKRSKAGLDGFEKKKLSNPHQDSNPGPSSLQPSRYTDLRRRSGLFLSRQRTVFEEIWIIHWQDMRP